MDALARAVLQTAGDPVWVVDRDFVVTDFNEPYVKWRESIAEDGEAKAWWREVYERVLAGESVSVQRGVLISGTPVIRDGEIVQAVFSARVTDELQQIISKKSYEWTQTFDAIALPVFITRVDGTIMRVNRAARDLVGGTFQEVLGRNIAVSEVEPWKTLADTVAAVRDSRTPCTAQIEDNQRFWDVTAAWYASTADSEDRVIIVMRDTTDLRRLSEEVRRGEQMSALGELVGGVAHEVRNPIFGIGITIDTMQQLLPDNPEINELADVLRGWLGRLNRLMENLLAYGKTWTLSLTEGSLDKVLEVVVDGCRQIAAQSSVSVAADIEPDLAMLMDTHRLGHAFENLVINAIQHSSMRQTVFVKAWRESVDGREHLVCSVRDHGPGFNPAELPRIFEPFFTKRRGGTGLGLSIVQRVVDEHGGTINAGNAEDGGAFVTVRFPVFGHD